MKPIYLLTVNIFIVLCTSLGCKDEDENATPAPTGPQPINFGTHDFGTMQDAEGNTYKTIVIGSATWMAQNLRVTKTTDGQSLEAWAGYDKWRTTTKAAYYFYEGSSHDVSLYGYLYNSAARNNVCPTGWRTPTSADWQGLAGELGGKALAGGKMKEEGTAHWASPNLGADNSSGFTGMPGGSIHNGVLSDVGQDGYWWSAEPGAFYYATSSRIEMRNKNTALDEEGNAIRCVKD